MSIHAPARGATCPAGVFGRWRPLFQSTLPRGERQKLQYISTRTIAIFQSTLPRGARRETQKTSGSQSEISIHAPARGATYSPHEIKERLQINFNPRSREGSDTIRSLFPSFCCHFNPRSREGSDRRSPCLFRTRSRFQSTLPRGERRNCADLKAL